MMNLDQGCCSCLLLFGSSVGLASLRKRKVNIPLISIAKKLKENIPHAVQPASENITHAVSHHLMV